MLNDFNKFNKSVIADVVKVFQDNKNISADIYVDEGDDYCDKIDQFCTQDLYVDNKDVANYQSLILWLNKYVDKYKYTWIAFNVL